MAAHGLDVHRVEIEVALHMGNAKFQIVGLADIAVQESKQRIKSAIKQSGAHFPRRKIAVNLAPADLQKRGPAFDLPIALSILCSSNQIMNPPDDLIFLGELNLSGELRGVNGILPLVIEAQKQGFKGVVVPPDNVAEARLVPGIKIYSAHELRDVILYLQGKKNIESYDHEFPETEYLESPYDFENIKGQIIAKQALEVSAIGGHNILLSGTPGCGKTLLAKTYPSILPPLTYDECIEVSQIYSIIGQLDEKTPLITQRPFRSPHHTASYASLIGGGRIPGPGEISLAHRGVLFLDEVLEFPSKTLETLRQPLEDRVIRINRVGGSLTYPAAFVLFVTMNPCPCGYSGDPDRECICAQFQIDRYQQRLSGPLLDRIDMQLSVPKVSISELQTLETGESSETIRKRVIEARNIQKERFLGQKYLLNVDIPSQHIKKYCPLAPNAEELLLKAVDLLQLSARGYYRFLKLSRSIADKYAVDTIQKVHIEEALQYRR